MIKSYSLIECLNINSGSSNHFHEFHKSVANSFIKHMPENPHFLKKMPHCSVHTTQDLVGLAPPRPASSGSSSVMSGQAQSQMEDEIEDLDESLTSSWMSNNQSFRPDDESVTTPRLIAAWNATTRMFRRDAKQSDGMELYLQTWFDLLVKQYSEPRRHYHTVCHLEEMFAIWEIIAAHVRKTKANEFSEEINITVYLAIWFHDVIYDPKSGTNEADSAKLYQQFSEEISKQVVDKSLSSTFDHDRIVYYILETQKHDVSESPDVYLQLFVDVDMAVLGKKRDAYEAYARLIRQEYIHVERGMYCEKRAEILRSFLDNGKPIFASTMMRNALEPRARENLEHETGMLAKGIIPGEPLTAS
jgi:predicted metal-dependent HD superfamily phosphohydrolase